MMAKSALSAPHETSRVSAQNPGCVASRPRACSASRGSSRRMRRARFCVEFPAMSTGMRAERAQARASRVTGHASASMMRVGINDSVSLAAAIRANRLTKCHEADCRKSGSPNSCPLA